MPPLPPVADVIKVQQGWWIGNNESAESILHFTYTGGPPAAADCVALAGLMNAAVVAWFKGLMPSNRSIAQTIVTDINSNTGAQGQSSTVTAGNRSGTGLTAASAAVINHQIARRYRGGKPRTYAPLGTTGDYATAGTFASAFVSGVSTNWNSMIAAIIGESSGGTTIQSYVSVSYYLNGVLRTTPHVDPILSSSCRTVIGNQRRRGRHA